MKRIKWIPLSAVCAILAGTLLIFTRHTSAQTPTPAAQPTFSGVEVPAPPYNPYPPGTLPADLVTEIARVRSEVNFIEQEALIQANALPPPTLTGQPPTLANTGQRANVLLGKVLNFDLNMSPFQNRACGFCHMPYAGFSGPIPSVNLTMVAYPGSFQFRAGKRTAQRYTYAPNFPVFNFNATQELFFGGNFWDSRASGYLLGSADEEQAQHPPVDTQEHAFPDTACVAFRLTTAVYKPFFITIWGDVIDNINFPANTQQICDTPGGAQVFGTNTMPIQLSTADRAKANDIYDHWVESLHQYEASLDVSAFSSKFDAFLAGDATLSADEMAGFQLFNRSGNCNSCHTDGRGTNLRPT